MKRLHQNQKGRCCGKTGGGRQKLLKLLLAGLLLGGFAAPAYAAEQAEETDSKIQFHGYANVYGNPDLNTDPNFDKTTLIPEGDIHGIDVMLSHNPNRTEYWTDTTSALIFNGSNTYNIDGDVHVVNTVLHENIVNNDAIYAINGANVKIGDEESNVYLASIGNVEKGTAFGNGSSVLAAKGGGGNNHITVSGKTVQLIGNLDFVGNHNGTDNQIIAILEGKNSFWYGDESNISAPLHWGNILEMDPGTLKVKLKNGAEWIYNANPSISALTLEGGIVNLQDDDIKSKYNTTIEGTDYTLSGYRSNAPHTYVEIGTLKGSGIFKADIDWNAESAKNSYESVSALPEEMGSDYIFINNFDAESARTRSSENEEMPMQTLSFDESKAHLEDMKAGVDKLYFATVSGNTGFKTEHSVYSNAANVFNYHYQAKSSDALPEPTAFSSDAGGNGVSQNWYIEVTGKTAEDNANFTAARSLMDAGYAMGTELDTLNKRMGEARYLDDDQGLWVRYRHGRSSRDDSYKTDSDMIQLGYDRKTDAGNGTHHRGVAFDYTDADTSLYQLSGSGDVDRYALSLYDTWMGNKGHYYDFVIRGGRINNGYDISGRFSTGMESMDNSYHQWFGSVSFEYGRKKDMSGSWYIEPQAQLQLARIGGASFTSASGVRTELDGTTSLIGRAGFRLGREFGSEGNDRNTFYIKADILHEFAGDRGFTLTGNDGWYAQNDNGTDTWYDVGIGVDLSLGHSTYFWTDVERILGSDFDNTWQVSGGLRWKW